MKIKTEKDRRQELHDRYLKLLVEKMTHEELAEVSTVLMALLNLMGIPLIFPQEEFSKKIAEKFVLSINSISEQLGKEGMV